MKFVFAFLYIVPFSAFGQSYNFIPDRTDTNSYDRIISLHEFLLEAMNEETDQYVLENTKIVRNSEVDDTSSLSGHGHDWIEITADIKCVNCSFDRFALYKTRFKDLRLIESKSFINKVDIAQCEFEYFGITSVKKNRVFGHLNIGLCSINGRVSIDQDLETCWVFENEFHKPENYGALKYKFREFLSMQFRRYNSVYIYGNTFPVNSGLQSISMLSAEIESLRISSCRLESLEIKGLTVLGGCSIDSTMISKSILMGDVSLNPRLTNVPWFLIADFKLQIREFYDDTRLDDFRNVYMYNNLIGEYKNLHNVYLARGDMQSANACFVEMKDVETKRMGYLYKSNQSLSGWFNWRFNQFFKLFCNYGTSPVKALKISLYTILCFAGIYFFFYSDWDRINRRFLMNQHEKIILYFKSNQNLEHEYMKRNRDEVKSYEKYKKEITKKTGSVPLYIRILGRPIYFSAILKHRINLFLYRRTDILKSRWKDLSTRKRIFRGSIVGVAIFFYLCYLVALKGFNSVFLSVNAFSTLGFGKIPVNGLSRYVAIIEGFTGWFLLSVFSISLIG